MSGAEIGEFDPSRLPEWAILPFRRRWLRNTNSPEVLGLVGAAAGKRQDVVDLEPHADGAAYNAPMAVALQDRLSDSLPGPTVPAAGGVVLLASWAAADCRALGTPGPGGEGATVEAAPHSLSPALTPLPEGADAPPDGRRVGGIAEEDIAEPPARAAAQARPVSNRAVGLGEPPVMYAPAHD